MEDAKPARRVTLRLRLGETCVAEPGSGSRPTGGRIGSLDASQGERKPFDPTLPRVPQAHPMRDRSGVNPGPRIPTPSFGRMRTGGTRGPDAGGRGSCGNYRPLTASTGGELRPTLTHSLPCGATATCPCWGITSCMPRWVPTRTCVG
jgi:hypothetical protein